MVSRRRIKRSLRTNFNPGAYWYYDRAKLRLAQLAHLPGLLAGGRLDRPIFIVGAPRSGTTLLYTIVRAHRDLAHWRPSEAHEVWEADYHPMLRAWRSNVLTEEDVEPGAAARIRRSLYLVAGPRKRLVDKTPRNVLRIPFIDALFPNAHYVYLLRDGRENVNSLINAWRSDRYKTYLLPEPHRIPGTDPRWWKFVLYPGWREDLDGPLEVVCARQWVFSNDFVLAARSRIEPGRWHEVRYEDLADDPVGEVARLLDELGLRRDPSVLAQAERARTVPVNAVTPPERGKWRRENPDEVRAVVPLIKATAEAMGYELDAD